MTATATLTHAEVLSWIADERVAGQRGTSGVPSREKWGALSGKECDWGVS